MSPITLSLVLMMAALASSRPQTPDPDISTVCPELFFYESAEGGDKPGQRSGKLVVESPDDLAGVWVRLVFDKPVKEVEAEKNFETVLVDDGNSEVLIKNRNYSMKAHEPLTLKITIKYDGSDAPKVIRYRLNARTVCPYKQAKLSDFYNGDSDSPNFLSSLVQLPLRGKPSYVCGVRSEGHAYPWQASLFVNEKYTCEATLIHPSYVLTPAHCVTSRYDALPVPTQLISLYLGANGAAKGAVKASVSNIYVHPGYESNTLYGDLALLKLSSEVAIDDHVMPICLGSSDAVGLGSAVVGYRNQDVDGEGEVVEVKAKRVDDGKCPKELQSVLADGTFCVVYSPDNENCAGNSGSNFISLDDNRATLQGIVSLGLKLQKKTECKEDAAAIVTDTSRYLKWLQRYLAL